MNYAVVEKLSFPAGKRILAVSDIHGNLPYFRALLEKARFSEDDELVLLGDMVEKGAESLDTLRFIMELSTRPNFHAVSGNCDVWHMVFDSPDPALAYHLPNYMLSKGGLLADMCARSGVEVREGMDMDAMYEILSRDYAAEFDFLRSLPTVIDTERYTFVHGGLPSDDIAHTPAAKCMKCDDFLHMGRKFDKWVIVGHWPVMLYREDIVCANPIIDAESRIVSIDGGCVLKDDGQLNALVIPCDGSEDFGLISYDPFPTARVKSAQAGSERSAYFRWGDNRVRVIERGEEFSLCEHKRRHYRMEILTKYLTGPDEDAVCNDCTDYVLPLEAGDTVSIVEITSRGYFVKHNGVSGWYYGELEAIDGTDA